MIYGFGRQEVHLNQVSAVWQKPGSAAEGSFGRRTPLVKAAFGCRRCPRKETFVSVWHFRPPKVPPNLAEFRLCPGLSAAEGAAEGALFSHFMHIFCDVFMMF